MKYQNIVTSGDPAGIGSIIIAETFLKYPKKLKNSLIIGSLSIISEYLDDSKIYCVKNEHDINNNKLNLLNIDCPKIEFAKSSKICGKLSYDYLETALKIIKNGQLLLTLPICKESWKKANINFDGHTEYLAYKTNSSNYAMIFASNFFNVVLSTIHIPLKKVPKILTTKLIIEKTIVAYNFLKSAGFIKPKIAICGLNPHSSENGLFGNEEKNIIIPAINELKNKNINVTGPIVPDSVFIKAKNKEYDMVVAMYHDQGLIPIKLVDFKNVVNITGGLPFWRISVSHGTAFDIVKKKKPDITSFLTTLKWAYKLNKEKLL